MGDNANIVAGADSTAIVFFAPYGTPLPASAAASLNVAFLDGGLISEDGVGFQPTKSTKEIRAAGSNQVQRVLTTDEKTTYEVSFLETNEVSVAVYSGKALNATPANGSGQISTTYGSDAPIRYAMVIDQIDGSNHTRLCSAEVEVSERKARSLAKSGEVDMRAVTITAYPDNTGVAVYEYAVVDALAGS